MTALKILALALVVLLLAGAAAGTLVHSRDRARTSAVWAALEAAREEAPPLYDSAMVAEMPEIAQRYFAAAIAPGTPLHRVVRLEMEGTFVLNGTGMPMRARQILAPPARGFVWDAQVGTELMRFAGSDGYGAAAGEGEGAQSWTKFWLHGLVPLARIGGSEDHARAAATRVMLESAWVPASLLPQFGALWRQTGPDTAEISFPETRGIEPMQIRLDPGGRLVEIVAMRWSDANPDKTYRLQPFGGRMLETARVEGFLIPVRVELGNLFGTPDYAPFFLATIMDARFGESPR